MKTLLILTTANQLEYSKAAIRSILRCELKTVDLLVIDDCSNDGTPEFCEEHDINILKKNAPAGLTHSWNLGYQEFKRKGYNFLIFANNDILVPKRSIEHLVSELKDKTIVSAMSTTKGVGHQPAQAVRKYYADMKIDDTDSANYQKVQDYVDSVETDEESCEIDYVNGFFYAVSRKIIKYELPDGNLFDASLINIGNEDDLCRRMPSEKKYVCIKSFIYHFKAVTIEILNFANFKGREFHGNRNMLWSRAQAIRQSPVKLLLYKVLNNARRFANRIIGRLKRWSTP